MFFKVIFIKQKLEEGNFMYNVLVCDDDKEIVEAIEIYLKREGYNILKAYNGREALKIVKENDLSTDSAYPEIEVIRELKNEESISVEIKDAIDEFDWE